MTKKLVLISIFVLIIIISGCINNTKRIEEKSYPNSEQNYSDITIHDLKEFNHTIGNFNIKGYVVKIYTCPPCPNGAICKPCMRDNIIISEKNELLNTYDNFSTEIIIFVENPKQFELGKKYKFSINITDYKSTGESLNDIELLGYNIIK